MYSNINQEGDEHVVSKSIRKNINRREERLIRKITSKTGLTCEEIKNDRRYKTLLIKCKNQKTVTSKSKLLRCGQQTKIVLAPQPVDLFE
jgi:hypothetical protein